MWQDFKITVHSQSLCNLTEAEQFRKEDWRKMQQSRCVKAETDIFTQTQDCGGGQGCLNYISNLSRQKIVQ